MSRDSGVGRATRPARLDGAPLDYAPDNEQGVIFLFSALAKRRYGLRVERIQAGFPDCVAYEGEKRIRIEFEYLARNFAAHRHDAKGCDWIVCWRNNWPNAPRRLRIVELCKEFKQGFNVWMQPVAPPFSGRLASIRTSSDSWSVAPSAREGDLILYYRTSPERLLADLFRIGGQVRTVRAEWKEGNDTMAKIHRVCALATPLHWNEMQRHRVLKAAGFVRGQMRGRYRVTPHWPEIYQMILDRNPSLRQKLKLFWPERII